MNQFELEEQQLDEDFAAGLLTNKEYQREMQRLQREYRESAREAAEKAYFHELENW